MNGEGERRIALGPAADHAGRLVLVVGEPVQDQVLLGGEVPEQRRFGDIGCGHGLGHRDLVEPRSMNMAIAASGSA